MSYSFTVYAETKSDACKGVADELAKASLAEPINKFDCQTAQGTAEAFISFLAEPGENEEVFVWMEGGLGKVGELVANNFTGARISMGAYVTSKTAKGPNIKPVNRTCQF